MPISVYYDPSVLTPEPEGKVSGILSVTVSDAETLPNGINISVPVSSLDSDGIERLVHYKVEETITKFTNKFLAYMQEGRVQQKW